MNISAKVIFIMILALSIVRESDSVTYAPPPAINSSVVAALNNSIVSSKFIGSKRI